MLVQIRKRKLLDVADCLGSDILYNMIGHAVIDKVHDPDCGCSDHYEQKNLLQIEPHLGKVYIVRCYDLINRITEENRHIKLKNH